MDNHDQQPFVLGLDCGGTKTKAAAAGMDGIVFDTVLGDGVNVNSFGFDRSLSNLKGVLDKVSEKSGHFACLKGLCIGVAGISNSDTQKVCLTAAKESGITILPYLKGDYLTALYGAHGKGEGILLISGTGSVCCGLFQGKECRTGGWGHLIDDEGSAYAIGRDVLSAVVRSEDGRDPSTVMTQLVFKQTRSQSVRDLIHYIYDPANGKKEIASLAPIVMKGYEEGEEAARRILQKASGNLAELVITTAQKCGRPDARIAFHGSVLLKNDVLYAMTEERIKERLPSAEVVRPLYDAASGAVLYTLEQLDRSK